MMADLFGKLPGIVRYNEDLSDFAKVLYAEIYTYNLIGETRIKNSDIADMYHKSKVTVSRAIAELILSGSVKVTGVRNDRELRVIDYTIGQEIIIEQKPATKKHEMSPALKQFLEQW
jgi:DNA-binding Lrp family transcriptional regulator